MPFSLCSIFVCIVLCAVCIVLFAVCCVHPRGLEDVSCYPNLTAELMLRGYTEEELEKILSGNLFRVLEAAEAVRDAMAAEGAMPSEACLEDWDAASLPPTPDPGPALLPPRPSATASGSSSGAGTHNDSSLSS